MSKERAVFGVVFGCILGILAGGTATKANASSPGRPGGACGSKTCPGGQILTNGCECKDDGGADAPKKDDKKEGEKDDKKDDKKEGEKPAETPAK